MAKITYIDDKLTVEGVEGTLSYLARDKEDIFYAVHTSENESLDTLYIGPRDSLEQISQFETKIEAQEFGPFSSFDYTKNTPSKGELYFCPPDEGSETETAYLIKEKKTSQIESWVYVGELYYSLRSHLEEKKVLPLSVPYTGW